MSNTTTLSPTKRFWRLLKPDSKDISNVYVYAIFNGLVNLSLPLGIQAIINLIQGGRVSTSWIVLVAIVVAGIGLTGVLQIFQLRITENLQQNIFTRAAIEFSFRLPRVKMEAIYKHYAPELMNRFFDTMSVQKGLSKILIDFSTAMLQVFFGLILLCMYHPFFIIFSLILVLLVFGIFRLTAKSGLQTSLAESQRKYEVAHWLEELARTHSTFKLAGETDLPIKRTDRYVSRYLGAREKHFAILKSQYWLLVVFKVVVATGLLAIGGILVMEQQMNIGQFVAAEIIILLVIAAVEKLVMSLETIYDVLTSLEKIGQVTDLPIEDADGESMHDICETPGMRVDLKDVTFAYPGHNESTLSDLSLAINEGEKVVITGPNGSGKSTLLNVLAGLYDVQVGSVNYNGLPKGNLHLETLRSVIGDCLTQEQLFEGTIVENITMGRPRATIDNVRWVIRNLGLEEFIQTQPKGWDTHLSPEGRRLPRSVVQKLLLARAIVDRPKLLLLEDAFEHIVESERNRIIDFVANRENAWTMVAVSSDAHLIELADRTVEMKKGTVSPETAN